MKLHNIGKILFITLSNIGDAVLTMPCLSCLEDNFPKASVDVVVGPRPKDIFARDPRIRKIFIYDKHMDLRKKLDFIKKLRAEKYDLAVDMRGSLFPVLIGAKNRTPLILRAGNFSRHKRSAHLNKLKRLGLSYKERRNIYIDDEDRRKIRELLRKRGVEDGDVSIGVSAACRSRLKEWQKEKFIEVIATLLNKERYKVILIGDVRDEGLSKEMGSAVKHKDFINLAGETGLNELCALIERLDLLLTCDSACLHIAGDLNVKVIALFGPTDPREYGPIGKDDVVIRKDLECSPCNKAVCDFGNECMKEITAEEVLSAIERLMGK